MQRLVATLLFLALALGARSGRAQSAGTAAAEALFQEGRALYQAGKHAEACPKLAESQRLDPATGTLLALALCHETQGKLATAWAEFVDVESYAKREGRADREKLARDRAAALRPRLSTLAVDVPVEVAKTPGLEVRVDGVLVGAGSFGAAVPVDGGEHRVEATAPGRAAWHSVVSVKAEADAARIAVPPLAEAPTPAAPTPATATAPASAPASAPAAQGSASAGPTTNLRTVGLIVGGAGLVALGIGAYLALDAKSDYESAADGCDSTGCPDGPHEAIADARGQGTIATIVFAVGGAGLAAGAVLWFVAPQGAENATARQGLRVERVGLGAGGVSLRGRF